MTAAWPQVSTAVTSLLRAIAPSFQVFDGPPVTADAPPAYVTVGYVVGEDYGGGYTQERGVGNLLEETGNVRCEVVCSTGEVDILAMQMQAFGLVDALEAVIALDQTLGVLHPSSTSSLAVDVQPAQTTAGAVQRLTVTLNYFSRS